MITILEEKAERNWFVFQANAVSEISKLPTTTTAGQDELNTIKKASSGSMCVVNTSDFPAYVLNGNTNQWTLID